MLADSSDRVPTSAATCPLCGNPGQLIYTGLRDHMYEGSVKWETYRCQSGACGLMWLHPEPTDEELAVAYASYYTHGDSPDSPLRRVYGRLADAYVRRTLGYPPLPREGWDRVLSRLAVLHPGGGSELARSAMFLHSRHKGARLLDVGSGSGEMLAYMAELGWEVEGVETDSTAATVARARGIHIHLGKLQSLGLPDEYADAVTLVHVLEHVREPVALLAECLRLVRPGGVLAVATPNAASLGHRIFKRAWMSLDPPRHLFVFDPRSLRLAAYRAGIHDVRITTTPRGARIAWKQSREIRRNERLDLSRAPGFWDHVSGLPFQVVERAALALGGRRLGEELLLFASKPELL